MAQTCQAETAAPAPRCVKRAKPLVGRLDYVTLDVKFDKAHALRNLGIANHFDEFDSDNVTNMQVWLVHRRTNKLAKIVTFLDDNGFWVMGTSCWRGPAQTRPKWHYESGDVDFLDQDFEKDHDKFARRAAKHAHVAYVELHAKGYRNAKPDQRSLFKVQEWEYSESLRDAFLGEDGFSSDDGISSDDGLSSDDSISSDDEDDD